MRRSRRFESLAHSCGATGISFGMFGVPAIGPGRGRRVACALARFGSTAIAIAATPAAKAARREAGARTVDDTPVSLGTSVSLMRSLPREKASTLRTLQTASR